MAEQINKHEIKTAILVDGGFYRKRAKNLFGDMTPAEAAIKLHKYCMSLLKDKYEDRNLYRIFYYDCPPSDKIVYHPLTGKSVNLKQSAEYTWMNQFIEELRKLRKVALRLGRMSQDGAQFQLKYETLKKLFRKEVDLNDIAPEDFQLNFKQKGVDMRIGVDISSLSFKRQVQQIILIAGDSDFVPASKQARREGIDFILDPMGAHINDDLFEHIDGIKSGIKNTQNAKSSTSCDQAFAEGVNS